jgi:hypothetical protein
MPGAKPAGLSISSNNIRMTSIMARKPGTRSVGEFILFDVLYEDDTLRSNRRVPAAALGGLEGDEPARAIIEAQDREIAERSGLAPVRVKSVARAGEMARQLQKDKDKRERKSHRGR